MLNPFPEFLAYAFFAPLVLRTVVALMLGSAAWRHLVSERTDTSAVLLQRGHSRSVTALWYIGTLEAIVAVGLLIGFLAQIAALAGIVLTALSAWLARSGHPLATFSTSTYVLMLVICASLLVTGAGAIAFDIPL